MVGVSPDPIRYRGFFQTASATASSLPCSIILRNSTSSWLFRLRNAGLSDTTTTGVGGGDFTQIVSDASPFMPGDWSAVISRSGRCSCCCNGLWTLLDGWVGRRVIPETEKSMASCRLANDRMRASFRFLIIFMASVIFSKTVGEPDGGRWMCEKLTFNV